MPIISAMPIIISATNFPVQCAMCNVQCPSFALIFLPPCKLHTVIHFPQASQSLNGRRKETASISAFLQPCSFFQKCFIQSCENLSWQSYAEELISNGQYWRWRRWWPIGHPRRRCLKLNLGFNWRVCSPFTSSVAHTLYPRVQHWSVLFTPSTTTHVQHWSAWVSNSASQNSK